MLQNIKNLTNNTHTQASTTLGFYYIETYGCQMNVYDSELVANQLETTGYTETKDIKSANIIFLNTCAIREKAQETVHNRLNSLAYLKKNNPKLLIGVLGCMAQNLKDEILETKPYVDIILGPDSYRRIPDIIINRNSQINSNSKASEFYSLESNTSWTSFRSLIK